MQKQVKDLWTSGPSASAYSLTPEKLTVALGRTVALPLPPDLNAVTDKATVALEAAAGAAAAFFAALPGVVNDVDLSPAGRAKKVETLARPALAELVAATVAVRDMEQQADARERQALGVPPRPTEFHRVMADYEVRQWWRDLGPDGQTRAIIELAADPATHEDTIIAVLQSPVAQHQVSIKALRQTYEAVRREQQPTEFLAIDGMRRSAEWCRLCLAVIGTEVAGAVQRHTGANALAHVVKFMPKATAAHTWALAGTQAELARLQALAAVSAAT
jgi:hypothetical protein